MSFLHVLQNIYYIMIKDKKYILKKSQLIYLSLFWLYTQQKQHF